MSGYAGDMHYYFFVVVWFRQVAKFLFIAPLTSNTLLLSTMYKSFMYSLFSLVAITVFLIVYSLLNPD